MYLILDNDNVWQASAPSLQKAKEMINDIKIVDKKLFGKTFTYKVVHEVFTTGGVAIEKA